MRHLRGVATTFSPGGRRRAGGAKPTPSDQVREVASTAKSPWLFSWRSCPHTREEPVADEKPARSASLAWLLRLFFRGK